MSDAKDPFGFGRFVPGFDFLQNLSQGKPGGPPMQGMPGMPAWVAPTMDVEEIEKRIQELKAVQFWLDQNATALKATVQALEVQKMTLAALRGMNFSVDDMATAFKARAVNPFADVGKPITPAPAEAAAPEPRERAEPREQRERTERMEPAEPAAPDAGDTATAAPASPAGGIDPMQWWGALTEQFQHIAGNALKDGQANAATGPFGSTFANAFAGTGAGGVKAKARKSAASNPAARKPAARTAAAKTSAANKPARGKSSTRKSAASKTAARKR